MKKTMALLLALALSLTLTACGGKDAAAPEDNAPVNEENAVRTVTDATGRTFEVPEKVERVVVLSAGECEDVCALGAGGLVVGRGEYCDYPQEVQDVPVVQSGSDTNLEEIIALEPQVVFMSDMAQDPAQIAALEKAGIAVCVTQNSDIAGVYETIRVIGEVLDLQDAAEAIVADMEARFETVRKNSEGKAPGTVYFEVSPLQYGLWTAGGDTFMNEISGMLGLENAFADVTGWGEVSEEQVIQRDPDFIVTNTMYFGEGALPADEILGRTGWENIAAVREGAVYHDQDDSLSVPRPGWRMPPRHCTTSSTASNTGGSA